MTKTPLPCRLLGGGGSTEDCVNLWREWLSPPAYVSRCVTTQGIVSGWACPSEPVRLLDTNSTQHPWDLLLLPPAWALASPRSCRVPRFSDSFTNHLFIKLMHVHTCNVNIHLRTPSDSQGPEPKGEKRRKGNPYRKKANTKQVKQRSVFLIINNKYIYEAQSGTHSPIQDTGQHMSPGTTQY